MLHSTIMRAKQAKVSATRESISFVACLRFQDEERSHVGPITDVGQPGDLPATARRAFLGQESWLPFESLGHEVKLSVPVNMVDILNDPRSKLGNAAPRHSQRAASVLLARFE